MLDRFIKCVTHLSDPSEEISNDYLKHVYDHIIITYNDNSRVYHTMDHIEYMLVNLDKYFSNLLNDYDKMKIELAIWFHDYIYDVTFLPEVNELLSAEFFKEFAGEINMDEDIVSEIVGLIMSTTHIEVPDSLIKQVICDLDLLGLHGLDYWYNKQKVYSEYTKVFTDDEFLEGRLVFLDMMINKDTIFHTGLFKKHFEKTARYNLLSEKRNNYA